MENGTIIISVKARVVFIHNWPLCTLDITVDKCLYKKSRNTVMEAQCFYTHVSFV